jgi:hypothetical protein
VRLAIFSSLFVKNFSNCQWFDFAAFLAAEAINLEQRVAGEIESDECFISPPAYDL